MNSCSSEQALRHEAIRRRLAGERRCDICRDLGRATSWFDKWWTIYQRDPNSDLADQSRAPCASPQQMPSEVVRTVVAIRRALEAARTADTRYGLIGNGAIQGRLVELKAQPLLSPRTIQRILQQHALTHPLGAGQAQAYYPWPLAWDVNVIQATDIITRHVLGQVVRLCLLCGVEPWFTPVYEAKRNYQIETFHSPWVKGFWSRHRFRHLAHVQHEAPTFWPWYHYHYQPPALQDQTPAQMRRGVPLVQLTAALRGLIPGGRLPITAGRLHVMRRVNDAGQVALLNETWPGGEKWSGEYVRATINTAEQTLTVWHQPGAEADWQLIKTRRFRITEPVHKLLPAFQRNRTRCRDY